MPVARSAARREALDAGDVPRPSTCRAAAPGPMPVVRSAARPSMPATVASGAKIKPGEPGERSTAKREALDAGPPRRDVPPLRQAREPLDAGDVLLDVPRRIL